MSVMKTYEQIEDKVLVDLNLQDETIVTTGVGSQMMGFCNEAIHVAESLIMNLCEDYFKTSEYLALEEGTADYSLPTDIYADKVRRVIYANGAQIYQIKKMWRTYSEIDAAIIMANQVGTIYSHMLVNSLSGGRKLRLYPPSKETSSQNVTIWYIRSARRITALSDVVDIPEFHTFIEKYMKMMCYFSEGHPDYEAAKAEMEEEKKLMIDSLSTREPDDDSEAEADFSHYMEST